MMRSLTRFGRLSVALAALAVPASLAVPALAQIPGMPPGMGMPGMGMFTQIELTQELVDNFIAAYPTVDPQLEALAAQNNIPPADDPAAAMAAMMALTAAINEMNAIVTPFGFTDFGQYTQVLSAVSTGLTFADPGMTAQERAMMLQFLPPFMVPTDANVAVIAANYAALEAVLNPDK
jgi:hypothetical protein